MMTVDIFTLAFTTATVALVINIVMATYGIFTDRSLLKKVIALLIFSDTLSVFAILIGFRMPEIIMFPKPPIHPSVPSSIKDIEDLLLTAVDPIPQAFIITAIVINLAVFSFLIGLIVQHYKHFKTLSISAVEEEEIIDEVY